MEKHIEDHSKGLKNVNNVFYLLGAVFGGITGGFIQETFLATLAGIIIGLLFSAFFVKVLLHGRQHDR